MMKQRGARKLQRCVWYDLEGGRRREEVNDDGTAAGDEASPYRKR